jgi:hypothetical protein
MHRGHKGEKRPADVIGNAVHVMRIATAEIEDEPAADNGKRTNAVELGRIGGAAERLIRDGHHRQYESGLGS